MKLVIDNNSLYTYLVSRGKKLDYQKLQDLLQASQVTVYLQRNGEDSQEKFIEFLQRLGWEVNIGAPSCSCSYTEQRFSADLGWEIGDSEVPISLLTDDRSLIRPLLRAPVKHRLVGFSSQITPAWFPVLSGRKVDFLNLEPFQQLFINTLKKAG